MSDTNVPPLTWTPQGWQAPLDDAILAGVQADFQKAFNNLLNFTTSAGSVTNATPQGQLASSLTAIIGAVRLHGGRAGRLQRGLAGLGQRRADRGRHPGLGRHQQC